MAEIEIFLQGEGIPNMRLARIPGDGTVQDIIVAARAHGAPATKAPEALAVWIEGTDQELDLTASVGTVGVEHRCRVHVHRCRRIAVAVKYNGQHKEHPFSPATTIHAVKQWAVGAFGLHEVDASEHVLQICDTSQQPDEDVHIGTLVAHPGCRACFDLVMKQRVQG